MNRFLQRCPVRMLGFAAALHAANAQAQHFDFTDVSVEAGVDVMHSTGESPFLSFLCAGGAAEDFDRDGWVDIFVLGGGGAPDRLFINNRDGTFTDQASTWGIDLTQHSFGASAADYNGDGWIDIFVTSYGPGTSGPMPMQHKLYQNNGPNTEGQCTFTNTASAAGVAMLLRDNFLNGTGSGWGDIDLDGDLDLSVSAYNNPSPGNRVFLNNGDGSFTDSTAAIGLEFNRVQGFLPAWVDFNGDRYPEYMLIGDTGSSQYHVNNGPDAEGVLSFTEIEEVGDAFNNAMGFAAGDVNNDGLLDMYVSGSYYPFIDGPGNQLMIQQPNGSFVDETAIESGIDHLSMGRGAVDLDYDNDGDQDIAIFSTSGPFRLYRNNLIGPDHTTPAGANWLRVNLDTSASARLAPNGIGSLVTISTVNGSFIESVDNAVSHCSTGQFGAHFGLADALVVETLRVRWNDGSFTTLVDVPANQILQIEAPFSPADVDASGDLTINDVLVFLSAYSEGSLTADQNGDGTLTFSDVLRFIEWYLLDA
eukprot:g5434.t1